MSLPESARIFLDTLIERIKYKSPKKRIVLPEGSDERVLAAASHLAIHGILQPIVLGAARTVPGAGIEYIDPATHPNLKKYAALLHDKRRAKGMTLHEAEHQARHPLYFGNLMTVAGDADGCVASAIHTTAETARAALHCMDMLPGFRRVSSCHIMAVQDRSYGHHGLFVFADASIMIDPTPVELADIAIAAAQNTRRVLGCEPLVALLSFSTKGSAKHKRVDKVVEALRYIRERAPQLKVDGELQADAALVESVGQSKSPGSPVAGRANTLIFPDLDAANIGYKLVERLGNGGLLAVLMQGLVKPTNIISRGCSTEDIISTCIITAIQSEPI